MDSFITIAPPSQALFASLGAIWSSIWWIVIPAFLIPQFWFFWMWYINGAWREKLQWTLLKVRVPKDVLKTPKAMEQVFGAAHTTYSFGIKPYDKYWNGEVEKWTSFEIMADADGPQFFIRTPTDNISSIQAAIYAQYPDAEIETVDDYMAKFPKVLPNDRYELDGADFVLLGDSALPIRTYEYFEAKEEEEKIDTIALLMEALSRHAGDATTWIQILVRPVGGPTSDWIKKAKEFRDKITGAKRESKPKGSDQVIAFFKNIFSVLVRGAEPVWPEEKKAEKGEIMKLSPAEKAQVEAIDKKISKIAFETAIRWVHINRTEAYNLSDTKGIAAWARQFADENGNTLAPNKETYTVIARQPFKKLKKYFKKRRVYDNARKRRFPSKYSIMNIEELATIYHFPTATVKAAALGRIEAKKGTPPPSLPIE
jgi:hypothetical protein